MKNSLLTALVLIFVLITACNKEDSRSSEDCYDSLPYFTYPDEISDPNLINQDNINDCTEYTYEWAPGESEFILLNPNAIIAPGIFFRAGTGYHLYAPERTNITLSIPNFGTLITVVEPNISNLNEARFELLQNHTVNANDFSYNVSQVRSKKELELMMAANYDGMFADVNAKFNWSSSNIKSRYIVEFFQVFYTVVVDPKEKSSDYLVNPSCDDISTMPVMVSSVKYGRVGFMIVESAEEASELGAALDASFGTLSSSGGITISSEYASIINDSSMKLLLVGGNPSEGIMSINSIDGFNNWIISGAEFSENNPGSPIGYTLSYLDGSICKVVSGGEFTVTDCVPVELCPSSISEMPEVGGNGGDPFYFTFPDCAQIESIDIRSKKRIDAIKIKYRDENNNLHTISYGGSGGEARPTIYPTSKITKITGVAGSRLYQLKFHFEDGTSTPTYGYQAGNTFTFNIPTGKILGGIKGRSKDEIDALGLIIKE